MLSGLAKTNEVTGLLPTRETSNKTLTLKTPPNASLELCQWLFTILSLCRQSCEPISQSTDETDHLVG